MFEEKTSYDFSDDILQTSFATTPIQQKHFMGQQSCKGKGKRNISEMDAETQIIKKTRFDIIKDLGTYDDTIKFAVQRKFPGPAGLLPDDCDKAISEIGDNIQKSNNPEILLCSQQNFCVFEKEPWQKMVVDFQDLQRDLLFEKFNISWIRANFSEKKQMKNYKAPFLACTIDHLELTDGKIPTVKVVLKDKTGTIQGTILHSLYEEYSNYFTVESVLILKQFGVLSAHNSHCLTITPNNLLTIYHRKTMGLSKNKINNSRSTEVKKIVLQKYSIETIWKNYEESFLNPCSQKNDILFKSTLKNMDSRNQFTVKNGNLNTHNTLNFSNMKKSSENNICFKNLCDKNLPSKNDQTTNITIEKSIISHGLKDLTKATQSNPVNLNISSSQISVTSDKAHMEIWKDLFQEVDTDVLFDDF